jgi:hypothetical protein
MLLVRGFLDHKDSRPPSRSTTRRPAACLPTNLPVAAQLNVTSRRRSPPRRWRPASWARRADGTAGRSACSRMPDGQLLRDGGLILPGWQLLLPPHNPADPPPATPRPAPKAAHCATDRAARLRSLPPGPAPAAAAISRPARLPPTVMMPQPFPRGSALPWWVERPWAPAGNRRMLNLGIRTLCR